MPEDKVFKLEKNYRTVLHTVANYFWPNVT